ncbi:MAG: AMP-binding protein, partial [Methanoregula sp.]
MGKRAITKESYEDMCAHFSIEVPEFYNFGFDVIDAWAKKDRNKLAMIWVNQQGEEKKYSYLDLANLSNQAANILLKYGINKGDRVLVMLPRIPEWWIFAIALIKLGAVFAPCPTMLTPRDIKYRVNKGRFRMIITDLENASKVEEICDECPTLTSRMVADGERQGWASFPYELLYPAPVSHRSVSIPDQRKTKSTDPMLIYVTSGTTGEPKMVLHDHSYP